MKQATQTFRTIEHTDGHTDIEQLFVTSFPDSDGKMITSQVWAVIQCGQKQEKQAMTYATAKTTITTREYLQRLAEKGYTVISPDVMTIQDVLMIYEQLDSLRDSLRDANEGAKLMYNVSMKGEQSVLSRLDGGADVQDAVNWQDEREPYTDRKVTVPQTLRSYATYNSTGKAQPLSAEAVDGERLGE